MYFYKAKSADCVKKFFTQSVFLTTLSAFLLTGCTCPNHYAFYDEAPPLPDIIVPSNPKIALVLGSGGAKGLAHIGVIKELTDAGISFDMIIGCSAGSLVGALYADKLDIESIWESFAPVKSNSVLDICLWKSRYGLSQGTAFYEMLDRNLDADTFEELKVPFYAVATDLCTGELCTFGSGPLIPAIVASSSIPIFFVPVKHEGRILVDGSVVDPVPVKVARDLGAQFIIAVDIGGGLEPDFPKNLLGVGKRSAEITLLWQAEGCVEGCEIVIRPETTGYGCFDDKHQCEIYEAGRVAAREALPTLLKVLNETNFVTSSKERWIQIPAPCYSSPNCRR
jgi:NTE family protein